MNRSNVLVVRKRKNRFQGRLVFTEAVVIVLLVHLLLYYLFVLPEPEVVREVSVFRGVSIADLGEPENRELRELLEYVNPMLVTGPDRKFGYSSFFADDKGVVPKTDLEAERFSRIIGRFPVRFEKHLPQWVDYRRGRETDWFGYPYFSVAKENLAPATRPVSPPAKVQFPECRESGGLAVKIFEETDGVNEVLGRVSNPGLTILRVEYAGEGLLPNVVVETGSGFVELDRMAWKALLRAGNRIAVGLNREHPERTYIVQWKGVQ